MVGDGTWLTVKEAANVLHGVHTETVRRYAADGLLRSYRMAKGHRRISRESADELAKVLVMPDGPERDEALAALRSRNQGEPGDGPASPETPPA